MGGSEGKFEQIYNSKGADALVRALWAYTIKLDDYAELKNVKFDFECLVLEGGGTKGVAYVGAVKVLEDLGILKSIKRFAGTSAGAYMAMQLAIGMPIDEIVKINGIPNIADRYFDSSFMWMMPYNIMRSFGWNSGNKLLSRIQDDLEKYVGDRNATFYDLYEKRGVELCVVYTDLNSSTSELCHPKTTPNLQIAFSVRASMSLPLLFAPTLAVESLPIRYCVDGGLLENFPLTAFDGWYLSMAPENDFFKKLWADPASKFSGVNKKTLGMVLYSYNESQAHSEDFYKRYGDKLLEGRPDTKLSRGRDWTLDWVAMRKTRSQRREASKEVITYLASVLEEKRDKKGTFSIAEFKVAINKAKSNPVLQEHITLIDGGKVDIDVAIQLMDTNKDRRISLEECLTYLQHNGIYLQYDLSAKRYQNIDTMSGFVNAIIESMQAYIRQLVDKKEDVRRTIGIYTDYITTTDMSMSLDDKAFLIGQAYKATIGYLKEYKLLNPEAEKKD